MMTKQKIRALSILCSLIILIAILGFVFYKMPTIYFKHSSGGNAGQMECPSGATISQAFSVSGNHFSAIRFTATPVTDDTSANLPGSLRVTLTDESGATLISQEISFVALKQQPVQILPFPVRDLATEQRFTLILSTKDSDLPLSLEYSPAEGSNMELTVNGETQNRVLHLDCGFLASKWTVITQSLLEHNISPALVIILSVFLCASVFLLSWFLIENFFNSFTAKNKNFSIDTSSQEGATGSDSRNESAGT